MKFTILAVIAICVLSHQHVNGATIVQTLGQAASGVASNIAANSGTILKNAEIAAGTVGEVGGSILGINNLAVSSESDTANLGLLGALGGAASGISQNIAANSGTILKNSVISAGTVAEVGAGVLGNDLKNVDQVGGATSVNDVSGVVGTLTNVATNIADSSAGQAAAGVISSSSDLTQSAGYITKNAKEAAGTVSKVGAGILGKNINNLPASSESDTANLGLLGALGGAASGVASNIAANSGTILKNAEIAAGTVGEVGVSVLGNDINNLAVSSESDTANLGLLGVLGGAASGIAQNIAANSGAILKNSIISAGTVAEIGAGVLGNDLVNAGQVVGATSVNVVSGVVGTLSNVGTNLAGAGEQVAAGLIDTSGTIIKNAEIGASNVIQVGAGILGI